MGASFPHKCDKCGYTVDTSGPWESIITQDNQNL